jgi:predicted nucleic acid-binding protein
VILVDTDVLVHSANPADPLYLVALDALAKLRQQETLCIAPQNLTEFWAVATRPATQRNGLGLDTAAADKELEGIYQLFRLLPYTAQVPVIWRRIVNTHRVSGRQTHDAHLAAFMQAHGALSILTFNGRDFSRYPGITVLDPAQV